MELSAGVLLEPFSGHARFVLRGAVEDHMNLLTGLEVRLQLIEERQDVARTLSLHVPDPDISGLGVGCGEQAGGAATQVVMRACLGTASDGW